MPELFPSDAAAIADDIGDLLHAVNRAIRQHVRDELEPLGITPAQARALRVVARSRGPLRMSELAARLGIARRSATTVVDELAARDLVQRRGDTADRRATHVALTSRGVQLTRRIAARRRDALRRMLAHFDADEIAELRRLLQHLQDPAGPV